MSTAKTLPQAVRRLRIAIHLLQQGCELGLRLAQLLLSLLDDLILLFTLLPKLQNSWNWKLRCSDISPNT